MGKCDSEMPVRITGPNLTLALAHYADGCFRTRGSFDAKLARARRAEGLLWQPKTAETALSGSKNLAFFVFFHLSPRRTLHCSAPPAPYYACNSGAGRATPVAGRKGTAAHRAEDPEFSSHFRGVFPSFAIDPAQANRGGAG